MAVYVRELEETVVRRLASIFGENSSAARALADASERRGRGEVVTFYDWRERGQSYLVVCPPLSTGDSE